MDTESKLAKSISVIAKNYAALRVPIEQEREHNRINTQHEMALFLLIYKPHTYTHAANKVNKCFPLQADCVNPSLFPKLIVSNSK